MTRQNEEEESELELYGDSGIASFDAKVPLFLKINYVFWPIWGIIVFYFFWNGSLAFFDRGYWHELQIAANTTFPIQNQNEPLVQSQEDKPLKIQLERRKGTKN